MKSIIQNRKVCYICGATENLHDHHIIHGANRKNSEKYGLKVWLCGFHHNLGGSYCVHGNAEIDLQLKKVAQAYFEKEHSHEEYMRIFGKNYL